MSFWDICWNDWCSCFSCQSVSTNVKPSNHVQFTKVELTVSNSINDFGRKLSDFQLSGQPTRSNWTVLHWNFQHMKSTKIKILDGIIFQIGFYIYIWVNRVYSAKPTTAVFWCILLTVWKNIISIHCLYPDNARSSGRELACEWDFNASTVGM